MDLKKVTGAIGKLRQDARRWEGTLSNSGITKFLSEGFLAHEITDSPGGMTVFMCIPLAHSRLRKSSEDREVELNERFGTGKLTEATIKDLAKAELFVPTSLSDALDQLAVMIRLLNYLTGRLSIASEGYVFGRNLIADRRREFDRALKKDPLFLARFLYMLDCIFQKFCSDLLSEAKGRSDPIGRAARTLRNSQVDWIRAEMRSFENIGSVPVLSLPTIIEEGGNYHGTGGTPSPSNPKKVKEAKKDKPNTAVATGVPGNQGSASNTGTRPENWKVPNGKIFRDFFGGESNRSNREGFPMIPHHSPNKKGLAKPCLHWFIEGRCQRKDGCFESHVPVEKLSDEAKEAIEGRLAVVYS